MMMDSFSRIFSFTALALLFTLPALAQDNLPKASQPTPQPVQQVSPAQSMPPDNEEVTILRDDYAGKYNVATLENLSKLYWRVGAFDFEDDQAISNYLKINDCKLYTEYFNDDLEWKKIIAVMKDHLRKTNASYPLNYQFVLRLHLGRYDMERGGFPVVDKTAFIDTKRIEVESIDYERTVCYDTAPIKDYPKSMIILLPEPFTLDFLKLDEHVAQAYILRKKSEFAALSEEKRVSQYEREAFLRLRVTFSQYNGNLRGPGNSPMAILYGNIDGYEIFEDSNQTLLMQSVDLRKSKEAGLYPQMSVPGTATP